MTLFGKYPAEEPLRIACLSLSGRVATVMLRCDPAVRSPHRPRLSWADEQETT